MDFIHINKYIDFITSGYDSDKPRFWEIRGLKEGQHPIIRFFTNIEELKFFFKKDNPIYNWYLGELPRVKNSSGTAKDIEEGNTLYVEFDTTDVGINATDNIANEIYKKFSDLNLRPSLVGISGNGIHTHFKLEKSIDKKTWEMFENAIIRLAKDKVTKFNPDTGVKDWARILRVLGTMNVKEEPIQSRIVIEDYSVYSIKNITTILGNYLTQEKVEVPTTTIRPAKRTSTEPCPSLEKIMKGVQKGWRHPGQLAITVFGYNNGWSYDEVKETVILFNNGCVPQKDEKTVIDNLDANWRAFEYGNTKEIGCKSEGLFSVVLNEFCPFLNNKKECRWMHPEPNIEKFFERDNKGNKRFVANRLAEFLVKTIDVKTSIQDDDIYIYNDGVWDGDGENKIKELIHLILGDLDSRNRSSETLHALRSSTYFNPTEEEAPPHYINLKNGLFDINECKLLSHTPDIFTINQFPIIYIPESDCPNFRHFIEDVAYPQDRELLQEFFGFCLHPQYFLRAFVILVGEGSNGKTVFMNVLEKFLGKDNISSVSMQEFAFDRFAKADLYGKKANICDDLPSNKVTSTGVLKMLTGESPISAQYKHRNRFNFTNKAKFIFATNEPPSVKDTTPAFWDRVKMITFPYRFVNNPNPDDEYEKQEKNRHELLELLTSSEELSGIFNWALEGLQRLLKKNEFSYTKTADEARDDYMRKANPVAAFLQDCTIYVSNMVTLKEKIYKNYHLYCTERGLPIKSYNAFCRVVREIAGIQIDDTTPGVGDKRKGAWSGIMLIENDEKKKEDGGDKQTSLPV